MSWVDTLRGVAQSKRSVALSAVAAAAVLATASSPLGLTSSAEGPASGNPNQGGAAVSRVSPSLDTHVATATSAAATASFPLAPFATAAAAAATGAADAAPRLPVHKLACRAGVPPPRTPLVLLCCGSFNPPTVMHLRCAELAAEELRRRGYDVWGAYLSPVADAYGKPGLAPASDRIAMCRLAAGEDVDAGAGDMAGAEAAGRNASSGPTNREVEPIAAPTPVPASSPPVPPRQAAASAGAPGSKSRAWLRRAQGQIRPDPEPDLVMVYDWEARQPGYTRTLAVLRRVESELRDWLAAAEPPPPRPPPPSPPGGGAAAGPAEPPPPPPKAASAAATTQHQGHGGAASGCGAAGLSPTPRPVRAMLLCGADVLASMAVPGVWQDPDTILRDHGVAVIARSGTDVQALLDTPGTVLYDYRDRVVLVDDRVSNSISSSAVRAELAAGRPARHLVPPGVLSYVYEKGLYGARVRTVGDGGDERGKA